MSLVVQTAESQFPSQQRQIDLGWFDEATYRTRLELAGLPADAAAAVAAKTAAARREAGTTETSPVALQCLRGQEPSMPKEPETAYSDEAGQRFHGKLDGHSRASWTVGA